MPRKNKKPESRYEAKIQAEKGITGNISDLGELQLEGETNDE